MSQYAKKARNEGLVFFPFVMESYGGIGKSASHFLAELSDEGCTNGVFHTDGMKLSTFAIRALSVCLQSGNAVVLNRGCVLTRHAAHGR